MIKKLFLLALIGSILVATAAALSYRHYKQFLEPFPEAVGLGAAGGRTVEMTIETGTPARLILDRLEANGVLSNSTLARLYLVHVLKDPPLQAGHYEFELPATPRAVLERMIDGKVVLETVTVIEGLTLFETAQHLASQGFGDQQRLLDQMNRTDLIADLDPAASNLEGYLFPDTYSFEHGVTEAEVVAAMVDNFRRQAGRLVAGAGARELVILASIVEKEATLDAERPLIAGVYAHRLRRGIGLYADPTIIYGKKLAGTWNGNLTRKDLRTDSAYNTYMRPGLPPGPICSPGKASLAAAAQPSDLPYLYFVSRNDGSHVFSATISEHNRNVEKWQRQYWRDRRAANGR